MEAKDPVGRGQKKRADIRTQERDVPKSHIAWDTNSVRCHNISGILNEELQEDDKIVIRSQSKLGSDVLVLGSSRPFRCLSTSCVSEKDFKEEIHATIKTSRGKGRKRQSKVKFAKTPQLDQTRYRYIQRLKQVIVAGNSKQNQAETELVVDSKPQRYQLRTTELIWLELQSWLNERSLTDQDQILYNARQSLVNNVLSFVCSFIFEEENIISISELNDQVSSALNQSPKIACDCYSPDDDEKQKQAHMILVTTKNNKSEGTVDDGKDARSEEHNHMDGYRISDLLIPSKQYQSQQSLALRQVGELLRLLCVIENLYPSSAMLAKEFSYYSTPEFRFKVDALCCWYNVTSDLRRSFSSFVQILLQSMPDPNGKLQNDSTVVDDTVAEGTFEDVSQLLFSCTVRALKQKSVKSILRSLIARHFTGLLRAKMTMLPKKCYEGSLATRIKKDGGDQGFNGKEEMTDGSFSGEDFHLCYSQLKTVVKKMQQKKLCSIFQKMDTVLSLSDKRVSRDKCMAIIAEDTPAVSNGKDCAVFGLPSISPLYRFFAKTFITVTRHCMHQRMKQAMPFFQNSASSVCLLTAKQLVIESKEMLDCAFLAGDIVHFFVDDTHDDLNIASTFLAYEKDLYDMITTYLDFVNTWLLRMQRDLPHIPRGFQQTLEQEWAFVCKMSFQTDLDVAILCFSRFINISADIVGSTEEFLVTATNELVRYQSKRNCSSSENCAEGFLSAGDQHLASLASNPNEVKHSSDVRAGVLWFQRQRSESPHLGRNSSTHSAESSTTASPVELSRQISNASSSSGSSLPWASFRNSSNTGFEKRYLFEVCRAVRDLFNETKERSTRILSFAKQLRKTLEPGVAYDITGIGNSSNSSCVYCDLMELLHSHGYARFDCGNPDCILKQKISSSESSLDFDDFWIMVPYTSTVGEAVPPICRLDESLMHLQNALLNHMKVFPQLLKERDERDCCKFRCVIFIKKQFADMKWCRHCGVEAKELKKQQERPAGDTYSESHCTKLESKSHSESHNVAGGGSRKAATSKNVFATQGLNSLDLICQRFYFSHDITVVASSAEEVGVLRKEFNALFSPIAKLAIAQMPLVRKIKLSLDALRVKVLQLCDALMDCIESSLNCLEKQSDKVVPQQLTKSELCEVDSKRQVKSEINEVMQSCFNFAFDFVKEATRIMSGKFRRCASEKHIKLVMQWMEYVLKHREKGNGRRPRWASQGLTFLCSLDISYWNELSDERFKELKRKTDTFINHLIGNLESGFSHGRNLSLKSKQSSSGHLQIPTGEVQMLRSLSNSSSAENTALRSTISTEEDIGSLYVDSENDENLTPIERVRIEIEELEESINRKRIEAGIIGRVSNDQKKNPIVNLGIRTVNFKWQRGARVGEGAFGRVYTCVNVDSGTILAMKEVKFHPNDHQRIRSAVDEYTNFEGIKHQNLVQYYGVELHRDEMYIFMEYCDGGTLADICKIGLPEAMVRKYSAQLLAAVNALHTHGIVHRDIKGSNVFLDSTGMIKLGDFGSAIKLKDVSKTTPGEMVSQIGTTLPYSAPEVINSSEKLGYGRASDIWSLGCVVVEMSSGRQPWHDLERFQVMFRIGSGESPPIPESLSDVGKNFIKLCTVPDPVRRWTADQLLGHPFVKLSSYDGSIY